MKDVVGNYEVTLDEDLAIVKPLKPRCRAGLQIAQTEEFAALRPKYVRDYVTRKSRNCGIIYLIHFDTPYKHAKHYLGYTQNLDERLLAHSTGKGARLMEVITEAGIPWRLAAVFYGDRYLERKMKKHGKFRYCPICTGKE